MKVILLLFCQLVVIHSRNQSCPLPFHVLHNCALGHDVKLHPVVKLYYELGESRTTP